MRPILIGLLILACSRSLPHCLAQPANHCRRPAACTHRPHGPTSRPAQHANAVAQPSPARRPSRTPDPVWLRLPPTAADSMTPPVISFLQPLPLSSAFPASPLGNCCYNGDPNHPYSYHLRGLHGWAPRGHPLPDRVTHRACSTHGRQLYRDHAPAMNLPPPCPLLFGP